MYIITGYFKISKVSILSHFRAYKGLIQPFKQKLKEKLHEKTIPI